MADVILSLTIPDAKIAKVTEAFVNMAGTNIDLTPMAEPLTGGSGWTFSYEPQQGGEGDKAFGERIIFELTRAFVRMYYQNKDTDRYTTAINNIDPPDHNIEDDILTQDGS